jgi:hypothetical protein
MGVVKRDLRPMSQECRQGARSRNASEIAYREGIHAWDRMRERGRFLLAGGGAGTDSLRTSACVVRDRDGRQRLNLAAATCLPVALSGAEVPTSPPMRRPSAEGGTNGSQTLRWRRESRANPSLKRKILTELRLPRDPIFFYFAPKRAEEAEGGSIERTRP